MLADIKKKLSEQSACCLAKQLLNDWKDGAVKLFLTAQGLGLRRERAELFLRGDYRSLATSGRFAANIVSFARSFQGKTVIAVAPRLITGITGFDSGLPLGAAWHDTALELGDASQSFRNIFTAQTVKAAPNGRIRLEELFGTFPVALLASGDGQ